MTQFVANTHLMFPDTKTVNPAYVKSLLHFDGADASTTFTDETGKTWSAFGNAQIDTAQSVFGGASGKFDGSGDYISTPYDTDHNPGSDDFGIAFRVKFSSTSGTQTLFARRTGSDAAQQDFFGIYVGGGVCTFLVVASGTELCNYRFSWFPNTSNFYHFEIDREGSNIYIFIDGVPRSLTEVTAVGTKNLNPTFGSPSLVIGRYGNFNGFYLNGWVDEFIYVNGEFLNNSNFTPPDSAYDYI